MINEYSGDFGIVTLDLVGSVLVAEITLNDGSSYVREFDSVVLAEDSIRSFIHGY